MLRGKGSLIYFDRIDFNSSTFLFGNSSEMARKSPIVHDVISSALIRDVSFWPSNKEYILLLIAT